MNTVEILQYAQQHDIHLWANGELIEIDAPKSIYTSEFREGVKRFKPQLLKTLTSTSSNARIVQANLRSGVPTLVDMRGIGRAYWVADEVKRDELQATLLAQGDDTPVFAWGELVLVKDWPLEYKRNIYQLKRRFRDEIRKAESYADG